MLKISQTHGRTSELIATKLIETSLKTRPPELAKLYANENFPLPVVRELRELGHDVLTSLEAGKANQAIEDDEVVQFAAEQERAVLTLNRKHFVRIHQSKHCRCSFHVSASTGRRIRERMIPVAAGTVIRAVFRTDTGRFKPRPFEILCVIAIQLRFDIGSAVVAMRLAAVRPMMILRTITTTPSNQSATTSAGMFKNGIGIRFGEIPF